MAHDGVRLGVDFGTSNTVAVLRWPDGRARPLLFDGSPLLPSAVYAEAEGLIVGRDAIHSARLEPARFEPNPKRRIDDGTVLLGDREIPIGELITAVLSRVEEERHRACGSAAADVTITCPASWGATRRLVLVDAANAAGLGAVRLVAEPIAAATYFTQVLGRDVPIGSAVVVHDFGAGTFDASVVVRTSSGFEVLAVDGRDDIGGLDVDEALVSLIGRICAERDPGTWHRLLEPATVEERRARRLLWDDARIAKERLSRSTTADVTVPLLGTEVHLTRDELEGLARGLLDQTVRVTQGVMRWARLAEGQVAGVFLVGGSSRIPLVATLLHRALGEAPVVIEQPELVVAEGSMLATVPVAPTGPAAPGPAVPGSPASGSPASGSPAPGPAAPGPAAPGPAAPGPAAPGPAAPISPAATPSPSVTPIPVAESNPSVSTEPVTVQLSKVDRSLPPGVYGAGASVGRAIVPRAEPPGRPVTLGRPAPQPGLERTMIQPALALPPVPRPIQPAPRPIQPQLVVQAREWQPASRQEWRPAGSDRGGAGTYRSGRNAVARAITSLGVLVFLVTVPVVSAYIAFKLTVGEPILPVDLGVLARVMDAVG